MKNSLNGNDVKHNNLKSNIYSIDSDNINKKDNIKRKVILITGASSGIGKAVAKILSDNGFVVYGTSRKVNDVKKIGSYTLLKVDVTEPNSIDKAINYIVAKERKIDVLINNAGVVYSGPIVMHELYEVKEQFEVNYFGTVNMINKIFPVMIKNGSGLIINLSSIGGLIGLPFQGAYSSSKFAIEGYSESLRLELKKFNIKVTVIRPGDVKTSVVKNRIKYEKLHMDNIFKKQYLKTLKIIEYEETNGLDPEKVANVILKIIKKKNPKPYYTVANPVQKLSVVAKKILPTSIFDKILSLYYKM